MSDVESVQTYYDQKATERLTPDDYERHRRAVARIQSKLFESRQPEDYFIRADSLTVLPPIAPARMDLGVSLGGVTYDVESARPRERIELKITHSAGSRFVIFLMVYQGGKYPYTRFAVETEFQHIGRNVERCVTALRHEQGPLR